MEILKEREKDILLYIIENYISQAEPVSSRSIAKNITTRLSSATIRNVMADLEKMGFLYKPHAVSGRVPTNKAFRYYIDRLNYSEFPKKKEVMALEGMLKPRYHYIEEVMVDASRTLAAISRYTSIVVEPKIDTMLFKEIEFVKMSKNNILVVFVTSAGTVHTRYVETDEPLDMDLLMSMKMYLNKRFEGIPFYALKSEIEKDLEHDKTRFNLILSKIKDSIETIIEAKDKREIYIDGTSKIMGFPEFTDIEKLRELFKALEKKEKLLRLLDKCLKEEGINVILGIESDIKEMRHVSIITSTYKITDKSFGILGVIGPVRMDYSRIIPIVNYTAKTVSDIIRTM
ncbi:MAG TPA: heat-inducible transcriptional repressor HrcA [Syntrophorhabdaceae bacterium]|nr:heat-inducible transcriptional repressor HrcA [Syntrophorhabdaceae bacterium]